ncbi:MAG: hypothetical protein ACKO2P_01380 [Planctomycetota bacterium]
MWDLLISLALMIGLTLSLARVGSVLQTRSGRRTQQLAIGIASAVMGLYLSLLWNSPLLVSLLPFSSAVILGNWLVPCGGFLSGMLLSNRGIHPLRRGLLGCSLLLLSAWSLAGPLLGTAPRCANVEFERILEFQTTDRSCSAACAAGLLRLHGISATEREMASLCLTRRGTHWLGVYRGLKLKTAGTEWDVVAERLTIPQILSSGPTPGVLSLSLSGWAASRTDDTELASLAGHSVVLLGTHRPGEAAVFDPSPDYGFDVWTEATLQGVDSAIRLRLVSRHGRTIAPPVSSDTDFLLRWNTVFWSLR